MGHREAISNFGFGIANWKQAKLAQLANRLKRRIIWAEQSAEEVRGH
jgi:hypothetical protein